ncbi:PP2C family protein-serine/threonine phosphatase [Streptomyces sp. NBC_01092]|uniref:PP2C family protein-serine/threonine phosphatase n=1 Tax=Streptomyces sp. NBC_01092 TaxID=2903748 RepID=UPI003863B128|nr:serine/threonine-protein phosphatase [Streptomyces sp. NBC_01092]
MVPRGLKDHRWSQEPRHPLLAVSILMIVIVTVVDILAPASVHLGPFLVAAPAVTASFAGPWTTAGVGVLAVTAQSVVAVVRTSLVDLNHSFQLITLILMSAFATTFAARREHHERELMQLRSVATAAQEVVLKPLPQRVGSLRIASVYLAAESEAQIGGDLYAAARTEHGIRIVIGDVRGKGLEAVGDAALLLGAFRGAAHRQADLPALMAFLEGTVSSNLDDPAALDATAEDRGEAFITAAALDIPDDEPVLHLINCGHPPPLLLHRDQVRPLEVRHPAPPLGLTEFVETELTEEAFAFEHGDIVLLYTDGVIEARNGEGTFYPLAERVAGRAGHGPDALLAHLCKDLLRHVGGHLGDDAAMVAIERVSRPS